jgi:hypothetical protein
MFGSFKDMNIKKKKEILNRVENLRKAFKENKIVKTHQHEVNPGLKKSDPLNYIYFTLPPSLNFQRNSPAMWAAALKTFNDPQTNYLFYPDKVVKTQREKVQRDLLKHKLSLQKNKHTDIWIKLSQTLNKDFNNDVREILKKGNMDVKEILELVRITKKKDFPYLSGAKMSNYWLYILNSYTDVKLKNMKYISIIPDTHVQQASIVLGITNGKDGPEEVANKWFELLEGTDILPIELHPVLWNWSRAKFKPEF